MDPTIWSCKPVPVDKNQAHTSNACRILRGSCKWNGEWKSKANRQHPTTSYLLDKKTFASWNAPSGQDMLDWLDRRPRDIAWLYSRGVKCISLTEISYLWRHASNTHISQSVQEFQTPNLGVQTSATRCSLQSGVRVHSAVFIDNNPGIYVVTWRSLRCTSNLENHQPAYGELIFLYIDIDI